MEEADSLPSNNEHVPPLEIRAEPSSESGIE